MESLANALNKIKLGFTSEVEDTPSCYARVGRMLRTNSDALVKDAAIVALYATPISKVYVHAAIETQDGVLIDEWFSQPPPYKFREADGRFVRSDMKRVVLTVSSVVAWLRANDAQ